MSPSLASLSTLCHERLENLFQQYLINPDYPAKDLQSAMAYGVQNGGKRIRPLLVYAVGQVFNTSGENLDAAACSIELIHSYSLIHDDLPAMDNSDLRRGKPSCHKAFNEATAILAGDALQPLAFEILANHPSTLTAQQRIEMISVLTQAAGIAGMAGGQALDMQGVNTLEDLNNMYQLKTGALLNASVRLGLIASNIDDTNIINSLNIYIQNIGLAFQIQDDLLDIQNNSEVTGKPQGLDQQNNKITYPMLLGINKTEDYITTLFTEALTAIEDIKNNSILKEIAKSLIKRQK